MQDEELKRLRNELKEKVIFNSFVFQTQYFLSELYVVPCIVIDIHFSGVAFYCYDLIAIHVNCTML